MKAGYTDSINLVRFPEALSSLPDQSPNRHIARSQNRVSVIADYNA